MDQSTIAKLRRTMRYAGAGLAAWRLGRGRSELLRQRAARHLCERLGRLRGLPQKVGQLLSMSIEGEAAQALAPLQEGAQQLDLSELLPLMEEAWGRDPYSVCATIEENGLAASLGQVHRALLHDGRSVAIKVQYPGMREALDTDLEALGWIAAPVGNLRGGFSLDDYRAALGSSLDEELDYRLEARNQAAIADAAQAAGLGLVVPEVVSELSSDRVLVSTWEDGQALEAARTWDSTTRAELGRRMLAQFLSLVFDHGLLHADPHPGNYRFRAHPVGVEVVLYDHGCVHRMTVQERMVLLRLISEAADGQSCADPYPLLVELGFDAALLRPLRHKLPALCRLLFEPFSRPGQFELNGWNLGERANGILGDDRLNFRMAGPARLLFFLRAFHGLVFYLRTLGEATCWSMPLRELCLRHAEAMEALELREPPDPTTSYSGLATSLCILVTEGGETKAKVTLPASAVERLNDFVDDDLRTRIDARGIDLKALIRQVRAQQFAPQPIFELEDGDKGYSVWLE